MARYNIKKNNNVNVNYLSKVDFSLLNEKWDAGYRLRLKEAPKVEEYIFKSKNNIVNK